MKTQEVLLSIVLEGEEVTEGKIPVSHLLELLGNLQKALLRTGQNLLAHQERTQTSPNPRRLKELLELELVEITHGSSQTVLRFARYLHQPPFSEMDEGLRVVETALAGIRHIQEAGDPLPTGFDRGVLLAWRDLGMLFTMGVRSIMFALNLPQNPLQVSYTQSGFETIQQRIKGSQETLLTVEGRLLMADFKETGMRLRVHPALGEPIVCLFDEDQKEEVLSCLLRRVRITGDAFQDPETGKINRIRVRDIEPLEDFTEAAAEIPIGEEPTYDFWNSRSIEELARIQGVTSTPDITRLYGTWPGETTEGKGVGHEGKHIVQDDFDAFVQELRHAGTKGGSR
jgi:hypothetical protein